jgi:uncharacterized membrane protein YdjX (TVP38/TMEM64 family)
MTRAARARLLAGVLLVLALAGIYWLLRDSGAIDTLLDGARLRARIAELGAWGPLAIVALMTLAILVTPIPSAPIALAAGAAYGHAWGTLYVLAGAEIGALAAFGIARLLGRDALRRWLGPRLEVGLFGSQNALTGIVFASRLLPFVSFDLVSYAAGLTVLSFWRFAAATLAGVAPASFLLAHFGGEMASGESDRILVSVLLLGALTLVPLAAAWLRRRRRPPQRRGRH